MFEYFGISNETVIIFGSALLAAFSFIAFAYPFLQRSEKREKFEAVIQKKKKALYQETKDSVEKKGPKAQSAQESLATFFKVQRLAGKMGENLRSQLLQAGIRDPKAPLKFLIAQIILPFLFMGFAMMIISSAEEPLSNGLTFMILIAAIGAGFQLPRVLIKNQALKRQEEINLAFPDALDMMLICVQGGIGLEQTIERIAQEIADHSTMLAEELGILSAEMAMLNDRRAALQDFARRVGSGGAKSFATAMIQAEQYGTSVSTAMRVMADELRDQRMSAAEQKAASLPPKLTVPMIVFFLPSLFVVILGPAIINATSLG